MKKINTDKLYSLCVRERFFTCGSVEQYQKMFDLAKDGITHMELAYIIYICSTQRLDYVYNKLAPLFKEEAEV